MRSWKKMHHLANQRWWYKNNGKRKTRNDTQYFTLNLCSPIKSIEILTHIDETWYVQYLDAFYSYLLHWFIMMKKFFCRCTKSMSLDKLSNTLNFSRWHFIFAHWPKFNMNYGYIFMNFGKSNEYQSIL